MFRCTRRSSVLASLSVCTALLVAACAGDDDDGSPGTVGTTGVAETTATNEPATSGTEAATVPAATDVGPTEPAAATTSGESPEADEREPGPGEHHVEDEGEPVKGGTLVFGLEADTANAWAPYRASYATSGYIPLSAISDTLFAVTDDGETTPLLVESVDHNVDYTEWTLHIRDGISFQDGTPLDGAAVKFNIDANRASPLTAGALTPIDTVTASGQDVVITIKGGPWVALPNYLTYGSIGYMLSPTWLASLPDVPQRTVGGPVYDAAVAATPADGDPAKPVGLGAFTFESYTPGNGNAFRAVRNEDYWRGPNGITGEDLPYLDAIEAVAAVDIDSRQASLRSGQFDAMHTANSDAISKLLDDDGLEVSSSSRYGDTSYYIINVAEGPELDPGGERGEPAAERALPAGAGPRHGPPADGRRARGGTGPGGQRPVPPGVDRLPRGQRLPGVRHRQGERGDGPVPGRARHRLHRLPVRHHERPVQRGDRRARAVDVGRGVRRSGQARRSPRSSRVSTSGSP